MGTVTKNITYKYGDDDKTGWNHLLVSIDLDGSGSLDDSEKISYDNIGNPKTYLGATMTWYGRQMTSYEKGSVSATFKYDADGLRGSKEVNGVTTTYQYVGDQLFYENKGNGIELYFFYDSFGNLNCIRYIKTADDTVTTRNYYTATNSQGDVIAIYHDSGNLLATYEYDAWGNAVAIRNADGDTLTPTKNPGHIAILNPIRYRGYYYDNDLGLYYLQSRYYDAKIGRFINADTVATLSLSLSSINAKNLFSYCDNNPINRADSSGHFWNVVIGAVVGAAIGAISTAISGGTKSEIVLSAVCGGIAGGLAATGIGGLAGQMVIGAVTSAIDSGYQNYNDCVSGEKTVSQAITSTVVDTAMGATFSAMGFDGSEAFKTSNKMVKNAHNAIRKLSQDVVHPTVKANSRTVLKQSQKYLVKEFKNCIFEEVSTSALGLGIGELTELYY